MSKVVIAGDASGTGTFTISAPNGNTDRTLVLPDEAGVVLTSASSLPATNLTGDVVAARITGALNASGSAPIYACRAWVNFNGTGTVVIRASGNVSSITDLGTGNYRVNFATAMPDANYAFTASLQEQNWGGMTTTYTTLQTGYVDVYTFEGQAATRYDPIYVYVTIFR